ncbi:hypothetical protein [Collimonas sp. PA-H2]|uniref:hypothetical protein n=1 Tax=Collimonas sp. PA-H2 TaxID=1881062 RepID=UPI00117E7950|nr:hypothetical protein [Collimonas sp. PA-H2]
MPIPLTQAFRALAIGASNLGNAGGVWLGRLTVKYGYALDLLPWASATVTAVALAATWLAARMETPSAAHRLH